MSDPRPENLEVFTPITQDSSPAPHTQPTEVITPCDDFNIHEPIDEEHPELQDPTEEHAEFPTEEPSASQLEPKLIVDPQDVPVAVSPVVDISEDITARRYPLHNHRAPARYSDIRLNNMNKVDPNLFITCRLCLEELGQYQIIPSIQEQIKSCYDIIVDAYDGLPQLMCQKCQTNLSQHYITKQKYLEKQNLLKQRVESQKAIQEQENKPPTPQLECVKRLENVKRRRLSSNSEESSTSRHAYDFESTNSWQSEYYKIYNCTLCTYRVKNKKYMDYHRETHKHLKNKYSDILNQYCIVKLDKFDDKPNETGSKDTVMLSDKKIVVSYRDYTIHYTPRSNQFRLDKHESPIKTKYPRKRNRLFSNSSSDTVVIDNDSRNKRNEKDTICIQISSDEEEQSDDHDSIGSNIDQRIVAQDNDYKTIEHITSNCYSKYLKRVENTKKVKIPTLSSNMESQLNHKVLSIGRKVLNGNFFNCTGLLRFLEYKNLPIMWAPSPNSSRDTNIVVRTLKNNPEDTASDSNWSYIAKTRSGVMPSTKQIERTNTPQIPANSQNLFNLLTNTTINVNAKNVALNNSETKSKILNANPVANPKPSKVARIPDINVNDSSIKTVSTDNEDQFSLPVIASTISLVPYIDKKEHLNNSNKVSNQEIAYPRIKVKSFSELMAPKALNNLGMAKAPFTFPVVSGDNTAIAIVTEAYQLNENQITNICHEVPEEVIQERDNITQPAKNNLPQICSDTSNYQSAVPNYQSGVPNNQSGLPNNQSGVPNYHNTVPNYQSAVPNYQSAVSNYQSGVQNNQSDVQNNQSHVQNIQSGVPNNQSDVSNYQTVVSNDKYVILDTVLLPNEKTSSPFHYLNNLLQCHGLILLYKHEDITEKYYCLIRFKVSFKQDTTEPVVFGMQLYYYNRAFCIKVKDKNHSDIAITSLSADWQWEIIKTFKGDVHKKLLINAQKVSREAHSDTQCLMSLLTSIKMKKVD
ncbi:hypothetical protein K1T71_003248 [Dendrolimus kikuchii]|uniref:Uncharacterized protein n=1 Tax=Dendrolimus kikuchii TaxID=765133 RepID=A0ACC1DB27_9NEOP|nr:hypothetical protein K1T71_003248 [Dendrolimus kikuchii]